MATSALSLASTSFSSPKLLSTSPSSSSLVSFTPQVFFPNKSCNFNRLEILRRTHESLSVKALTLDFSGSFFEGGVGEDDESPSSGGILGATEEKEEPQCPPGLRQYETMAVLRPDMTEDERLTLTQKYEELIVAGGGMYVEVFNRGVIPLAYSIKKKNKAGETNTYLDGIYLLFTYFTKPESITALEARLIRDDDVIRSSSFKIRKRKY
ncbi:hypothetical protein C5167_047507 [Papaver somniferum]|uniref:30S ribosomal protein S6 alpha, chloroplastic n=1 Tax=Papaver somniferum TaxID=3469 RepID=A0A4Y7LJ44_PAPSO|nr:30S ribosomal protein S6 alpha, chloroplastic-like [Papaver somniferum]XP_026427364.1 30S ribosomal protein S6 alpha, chloroplastic-like [Papaver somniferum]RZC84712.1 hypothetical protein C5167_047507 [Papaver somniferum]